MWAKPRQNTWLINMIDQKHNTTKGFCWRSLVKTSEGCFNTLAPAVEAKTCISDLWLLGKLPHKKMAKSCRSVSPLVGAAASWATPPLLLSEEVLVGKALTIIDAGGKTSFSSEAKSFIHSGETMGTPASADLMALTVRTLGRTKDDSFPSTTGRMHMVEFFPNVLETRNLTAAETKSYKTRWERKKRS